MKNKISQQISAWGIEVVRSGPRRASGSGARRRRAFAGLVEALEDRELLSLSGGGGLFIIVPKVAPNSALTVPAPAGSSSDGTPTTISAKTGGLNQLWSVQDNGNGYYSIIPVVAPTLCLDERDGGDASIFKISSTPYDGTAAQVYHANAGGSPTSIFQRLSDVHGSYTQNWSINDVGNGNGYDWLSPRSGPDYNLDVTNGDTADGTYVQLYHPNNGNHTDGTLTDAQQWQFVRQDTGIVDGGIYSLAPKLNLNGALEVPGFATSASTQLDIFQQNGGANQLWRVNRNADGTYVLSPLNAPGEALDERDGGNIFGGGGLNAPDGTAAQIYQANSTSSQNWQLTPTGGGFFMLSPQSTPGLYNLDVTNGNSADGTSVQIYHRNSGQNSANSIADGQQWLFEAMDTTITSGSTYQLVPKLSLGNNMMPEALSASGTTSGSQVKIQTRDQTGKDQSQIWAITQNSDGSYRLVPQNATDKSLDKAGSGGNGTAAQVYTTNNNSAQAWMITQLRNVPYVTLSPESSLDKDLTVTNGVTTPGTGIQVYFQNSNSEPIDATSGVAFTQEWLLVPTRQPAITITTDPSAPGLPDYTPYATLAKRANQTTGGSSSTGTTPAPIITPYSLAIAHILEPEVYFNNGIPGGIGGFHWSPLLRQSSANPSNPGNYMTGFSVTDTRYLPDGSEVYSASYTYHYEDPSTHTNYSFTGYSTFFPDSWNYIQIEQAVIRAYRAAVEQSTYQLDPDYFNNHRIIWNGTDPVTRLPIRGVFDDSRNTFVTAYPRIDSLPSTPPVMSTNTTAPSQPPPSFGSSGGIGVIISPGHDPGELRLVLDEINGLDPASTTVVPLTVEMGGQSLQDVTFAAPSGVSVELTNGAFLGGSPSLIIQSGNLTVSDSTLSNATAAPTIVVQGGSLALRNDSIEATSGSSPEAVLLSGGSLDLGTTASPGGNTIVLNGPGQPVTNIGSNPESDAGNSFVVNGLPLSATSLSFTSLVSSLANPVYGQMMTLTASVSAGTAGAAAPTGSIDFFDTSTNSDLGTVMLTGGVAQFMASALTAGGHTIQARYSGDPGYCFSQGSLTESVAPAPLAVTAVGTKVYGQSAGAAILTPFYSGFVNNESTAVLGGAPVLVNAVGATADVGPYPGAITVGSGTLVAANYYFVLQTGTLTVIQAPLVVTAAGAARYYGDPNPAFTGSIAGIQNNDAIMASYGTPATPASDVGSYPITPTPSGAKLFDYAVTNVNGSLTIQQAPSAFTGLSAPTVVYKATSTTFSGRVSYHTVAPPAGEVVTISLNGTSRLATIADGNGDFAATLPTGGLAAGTYTITYSYGGDKNFQGIGGTTTLLVTYATTVLTDLSKPKNGGSTLPIDLQVNDAFGNDVSSASLPVTVIGIASATNPGVIMPPAAPGNSFPGGQFVYDPTSGTYRYNLKLVDSSGNALAPGTYNFYYRIGNDPVTHMFQFLVK